ncbi:hypothetical protein AMTRI_Chr07g77060 [Amborella trichopoda]
MALSSFDIVIIMNNQVTVPAKALPLPCRVVWIFLIIKHRIILCPFTFLGDWTSLVIFHCPIYLLIIMCLIFILCIIIIVGIHVHHRVSFIWCCNIRIIIHIGNCPTKEILV